MSERLRMIFEAHEFSGLLDIKMAGKERLRPVQERVDCIGARGSDDFASRANAIKGSLIGRGDCSKAVQLL
jgi:hypothetical protein